MAAGLHLEESEEIVVVDDRAYELPWGDLVDKVSQTALLLVIAKLVTAWAIVALWGVEIRSRMLWGFIPYAGLQTSAAQFRTVAGWSTAIVALIAVVWATVHFARRKHHHPVRAWAAAAAIPMSALLTLLEWYRRFDADHLIPTSWMVRILLFLGVAAVLFLGFIEHPSDTAAADEESTTANAPRSLPKISAQP
jgi:hypothetical protein